MVGGKKGNGFESRSGVDSSIDRNIDGLGEGEVVSKKLSLIKKIQWKINRLLLKANVSLGDQITIGLVPRSHKGVLIGLFNKQIISDGERGVSLGIIRNKQKVLKRGVGISGFSLIDSNQIAPGGGELYQGGALFKAKQIGDDPKQIGALFKAEQIGDDPQQGGALFQAKQIGDGAKQLGSFGYSGQEGNENTQGGGLFTNQHGNNNKTFLSVFAGFEGNDNENGISLIAKVKGHRNDLGYSAIYQPYGKKNVKRSIQVKVTRPKEPFDDSEI